MALFLYKGRFAVSHIACAPVGGLAACEVALHMHASVSVGV